MGEHVNGSSPNTMGRKISAPVIIFEHKSIVPSEYPLDMNGCFYEEIKDFAWDYLLVPHSTKVDGTLDGCKESDTVRTNNDKARQTTSNSTHRKEENLESVTENAQNGELVTRIETCNLKQSRSRKNPTFTFKTKMNLKDRIQARIKQSPKQPQDDINDNQPNHNMKDKKVNGLKIEKQCDCGNCDDFIKCPTWFNNNLSFDTESNNTEKGLPLLKNSLQEKKTFITKKITNNLILLGPVIPKPITSIEQTFIDENIKEYLKTSHGSVVTDTQMYMLLAVQRGLNVFMVGPSTSGKTHAYLPAFCSFCIEKNDRYTRLAQLEGPLIIILCPNDEACWNLERITRDLVSRCPEEVAVETLTDKNAPQNNCDILIANPSVLEDCLRSGTVKLKRLCHLAIEGAHVVFKGHHGSVGKLLRLLNDLPMRRPHNKNLQIVVTSEKWSMDMDTLQKKLYTTPLLCFEDYLEAAAFSKVQFNRRKLKSSLKLCYLNDVLKPKYMTHKSVIFCDDDIVEIRNYLEVNGIECIAITNNLSDDEIFENTDMWSALRCGYYKVLLCTDSTFEKTDKVSTAEWLFHYSLTSDAIRFQKRFKCLSTNLCSQESEEFKSRGTTLISFFVFDELVDSDLLQDIFEHLTRNSAKFLQL